MKFFMITLALIFQLSSPVASIKVIHESTIIQTQYQFLWSNTLSIVSATDATSTLRIPKRRVATTQTPAPWLSAMKAFLVARLNRNMMVCKEVNDITKLMMILQIWRIVIVIFKIRLSSTITLLPSQWQGVDICSRLHRVDRSQLVHMQRGDIWGQCMIMDISFDYSLWFPSR